MEYLKNLVNSSGRLPYLDGWRGLAVLGVLFDHYLTSRGINLGRFGVELFFVLSGRLIAEILFVNKIPLHIFYIKRISRIYPTLLICMFAIFLVRYLIFHKENIAIFISTITMTYNYAQIYTGNIGPVDHIWSLCIEEHVYIILGGIAFLSRKLNAQPILFLIPLCLLAFMIGAFCTLSGESYTEVYWRTDVRGASILLGSLMYLLSNDKNISPIFQNKYLFPASFILSLVFNINIIPDYIKYTIGTTLLSIAIVSLGYAKIFTNIFSFKPLIVTGIISYSLYLWQQPFIPLAERLSGNYHIRKMIFTPAILMVIFVTGLLSYYYIETPSRRWLNQRFGKPAQ